MLKGCNFRIKIRIEESLKSEGKEGIFQITSTISFFHTLAQIK